MPPLDDPRDEALDRLNKRLGAFQAKRAPKPPAFSGMHEGSGEGLRYVADLIGGVLCGLGLGWLADRLTGAAPIGLISGLLIGLGLSIYLVVRRATQMAARTAVTPVDSSVAPVDDADNDPTPGVFGPKQED